ncbi:glycoside hydrolase family 2 protein [Massiliimalia massiliensis]|uniref:glycoside hydrolase family 2 protein n=1 Tax=Massiliimalia massiliensis TaxID=1852384 RepID=UPI0009874E2B|nr:hypothetical protein [Massiliimalia massiliensis]
MVQIICPQNWELSQYGRELPDHTRPEAIQDRFQATVPGCVHYDLMEHGRLKNPYASTQAAFDAAWVAKSDWLYETKFDAPERLERYPFSVLKVYGIDTFSEIWLNGHLIGETRNAYQNYEFTVPTELFIPKGNLLQIRVKAHERMVENKLEAAKRLKRGNAIEGMLGKSLIRRYQRSFFTTSSLLNLGTGVLGIGIYRPIELRFYSAAFLTDVAFSTNRLEQGKAFGIVEISLAHPTNLTELLLELLDQSGKTVWKFQGAAQEFQKIAIELEQPHLWWPVGYGEAYLYTLKASVIEMDKTVDQVSRQVGIRTTEIVRETDTGRKTFYFRINGKRIFVKGQNYIPMDYLKVYSTEERYQNMFQLIENSHVNLIRMWGGGAMENQSFYDTCDEKGILIWQDFFLHSNVYPDYDPEFVSDFVTEIECIIKHIRSHPCLCIICGGNEQQEGWDEWGMQQELDQFYGISLPLTYTPPVVERLCGNIPYIYNSPHGGKHAQSPVEGESHNWGSYYNAGKDPTFVTETCWTTESYSRPRTLQKYMDIDVKKFTGQGWGEKWKALTSLELQNRHPFSSLFDYSSLEAYLYNMELEQALADYNALSQFRFKSPSCNGIVYWSWNKGGPLFQFGCVDYGGEPLMSYYFIQRLYQETAVYPYRDVSDVRIMASHHGQEAKQVTIEAYHLNGKGEVLHKWEKQMIISPGQLCRAMELIGIYDEVVDRTQETIFVRLLEKGKPLSEDLLLFCPYSELLIPEQRLSVSIIRKTDQTCELCLKTDTLIQMVQIEGITNIMCSSNYFPMLPHSETTVQVTFLEPTVEQPVIKVGAFGSERVIELSIKDEERN